MGCKLCNSYEHECYGAHTTRYGEFGLEIDGTELTVRDDYGHEDILIIKYCPMCGRELI